MNPELEPNTILNRDCGPWTFEKLDFLQEYLPAYVKATTKIRNFGGNVCFVDIFSGPGYDRNRDTGVIREGSPLIAMSSYPGFNRFIFIDLERDCINQLRTESIKRGIEDSVHYAVGDANVNIHEALRNIPSDGATFCFIDPPGIDVKWKTIESLARCKPPEKNKVELFILFAYDMDLVRFLVREGSPSDVWGSDVERRIDEALPPSFPWRSIYRDRNEGIITAQEARRRFTYVYWKGLRNLGYRHVIKPKRLNSPNGRPLYFLFFASDHPAGESIMSHILHKPRSFEQLTLPFLDDPWDFKEGEEWYEDSISTESVS